MFTVVSANPAIALQLFHLARLSITCENMQISVRANLSQTSLKQSTKSISFFIQTSPRPETIELPSKPNQFARKVHQTEGKHAKTSSIPFFVSVDRRRGRFRS